MRRRDHALAIGRSLARVSRRRLRHGPLRPSWPLPYEAAVDFLRHEFAKEEPLAVARRKLDSVGVFEERRRRVDWREERIGAMEAIWALPPGHDDRVLLYLHGGGYCVGSYNSHRNLIANIALRSRARILAINYRLAPEHPCPAAIEDAVAAWRWLLDAGQRPERSWIGGDSAGGGLTITTLVALRDAGLPMPRGGFAISPWADLELTGDSLGAFQDVDYLSGRAHLDQLAGHYAGELPRHDPRVTPLHADLSGLPPLLLLVGGSENLRDDSLRLAERARQHGVQAQLILEPDEVHVFPMFADLSETARRALHSIAAFLTAQDATGRGGPSST